MKLEDAMARVCEEIKTDAGYRYGWQANIAMAFVDELQNNYHMEDNKFSLDLSQLVLFANSAADRFLNLLVR